MSLHKEPISQTLISGKCENEKDTTFSFSFYYKSTMKAGKLSFNIFVKGERAPVFTVGYSRSWINETKLIWQHLLKNFSKGKKETFSITRFEWDKVEKKGKSTQIGNIAYGFDQDKGLPFIAISHNGKVYKCPLNIGAFIEKNIVRKEEYFTPEKERELIISSFIDMLDEALNLMTYTLSLPKDPLPTKDGRGNTSASSTEVEDEIPF